MTDGMYSITSGGRICKGLAFVGLTQRTNTLAFGGAPVIIVNLANDLVARGVSVEVLIFTREGVTEFPFPFDSRVKLNYLRASSRAGLFVLVVLHLLRLRPRAILAIGTKANLLCAHATKIPGIRARFWSTFHHNLSSEIAGWGARKRKRRIRLWRRLMRRADGLIAVSRGVANDFSATTGVGVERIRVVYNPIVDPGLVERGKEPANHPWLMNRGSPVILGVGRLTKKKDFATLVSAFALVRRQRSCRLLIIGEGEERGHLEALAGMLGIGDSRELAGFRPNPLPFMREARLLVMSSRWEGLGNVFVEALYCGTAVVSTDCPHGPREVLGNGKFGRLVPLGDPGALAEAIVEALDEEPDPQHLRARAEVFSVARCVDGYLQAMGLTSCGRAPES